jgi:transposase
VESLLIDFGIQKANLATIKQRKITEELKREAMRLLVSRGRSVSQVAADLGISKSTQGRWKLLSEEAAFLAGPHEDMQPELQRLRHENQVPRQERDLLKNAAAPLRLGNKSKINPVRKHSALGYQGPCAFETVS